MNDKEGRARTLARLQAGSGLVFFAFLVLHLVNTMFANAGPAVYDGFQRAVRPVYQSPAIEGLMIGAALTVHVVCGVKRARLRGPAHKAPGLRLRLHRYSAYFLSVVIVGHVLATRGAELFFGVFPEFGGVAWAMATYPLYFYPYYTLLALSGLYHGVHGVIVALGIFGVRVPSSLRKGPGLWVPVGVCALLLVSGVLSFGGVLFPLADLGTHPYAKLAKALLARFF